MRKLLFADDDGLFSHSTTGPQSQMDRFAASCETVSQVTGNNRSVVIHQLTCTDTSHADIIMEGTRVGKVNTCFYLGTFVANGCSPEKEIQSRFGKAVPTFSRLISRTWYNPYLALCTKGNICKACISALFSQFWKIANPHAAERKLNSFQMWFLAVIAASHGKTDQKRGHFPANRCGSFSYLQP